MQFASVTAHENRRFVPIKGWDGVSKALEAYVAGEITSGSRADAEFFKDIGEIRNSGPAAAMAAIIMSDARHSSKRHWVLEEILREAPLALKRTGRYQGSWDHEAMGTPFMKGFIEIRMIDRRADIFGIAPGAAYIGMEPQNNLAAHYGVELAVLAHVITATAEPVPGKRFSLDFEPILGKLGAVPGLRIPRARVVAKAMVKQMVASIPTAIPELLVRVRPASTERHRRSKDGKRIIDTWSAKGTVFSGDLQPNYSSDDPEAKRPPQLMFTVTSSRDVRMDEGAPIWQPELQKKARRLAEQITAALS